MKLFCFRPSGHGPKSFYVAAETEDEAKFQVTIQVEKARIGCHGELTDYCVEGWPEKYEVEVLEPGQLGINDND